MHRIFITLTIVVLVASVLFSISNQENQDADEQEHSPSSSSTHRFIQGMATSDFEQSLRRAISGTKEEKEAFKNWMIQASALDFLDQLSHIRHSYEDNPIKAFEELEETFREAAAENPASVLRVLDILSIFPKVSDLERDILHNWLEQNPEELLSHMGDPKQALSTHTLSILSSLYQNEQSAKLDEFLAWGDQFKESSQSDPSSPENQNQWRNFVRKLSLHAKGDTVDQVATYLTENLDSPHAVLGLTSIIPQYIESIPEESLTWLQKMELNNEDRSMVMGVAVQSLSKSHPEAAARLLNSDQFITDYYKPNPDHSPQETLQGQQRFYDDMLQNYLLETLTHSPETAIENSQLFFDPKYRDTIVKIASEYLQK